MNALGEVRADTGAGVPDKYRERFYLIPLTYVLKINSKTFASAHFTT